MVGSIVGSVGGPTVINDASRTRHLREQPQIAKTLHDLATELLRNAQHALAASRRGQRIIPPRARQVSRMCQKLCR